MAPHKAKGGGGGARGKGGGGTAYMASDFPCCGLNPPIFTEKKTNSHQVYGGKATPFLPPPKKVWVFLVRFGDFLV